MISPGSNLSTSKAKSNLHDKMFVLIKHFLVETEFMGHEAGFVSIL
jgi:hypothetical protein